MKTLKYKASLFGIIALLLCGDAYAEPYRQSLLVSAGQKNITLEITPQFCFPIPNNSMDIYIRKMKAKVPLNGMKEFAPFYNCDEINNVFLDEQSESYDTEVTTGSFIWANDLEKETKDLSDIEFYNYMKDNIDYYMQDYMQQTHDFVSTLSEPYLFSNKVLIPFFGINSGTYSPISSIRKRENSIATDVALSYELFGEDGVYNTVYSVTRINRVPVIIVVSGSPNKLSKNELYTVADNLVTKLVVANIK